MTVADRARTSLGSGVLSMIVALGVLRTGTQLRTMVLAFLLLTAVAAAVRLLLPREESGG